MFRKFVCALAAMGIVAVVSGCNTMEGAGKDVEKAGQKVETEADRHK